MFSCSWKHGRVAATQTWCRSATGAHIVSAQPLSWRRTFRACCEPPRTKTHRPHSIDDHLRSQPLFRLHSLHLQSHCRYKAAAFAPRYHLPSTTNRLIHQPSPSTCVTPSSPFSPPLAPPSDPPTGPAFRTTPSPRATWYRRSPTARSKHQLPRFPTSRLLQAAPRPPHQPATERLLQRRHLLPTHLRLQPHPPTLRLRRPLRSNRRLLPLATVRPHRSASLFQFRLPPPRPALPSRPPPQLRPLPSHHTQSPAATAPSSPPPPLPHPSHPLREELHPPRLVPSVEVQVLRLPPQPLLQVPPAQSRSAAVSPLCSVPSLP